MSDGGAAVIGKVVSILSESREGRIVLLVVACYFTLQYVISQLSRAALFGIAVLLLGLAALVIAFFVQRRRRRERASLHQLLAILGLVIVAGATALFVVVRRRKTAALPPPPAPAELERLVAQAGWRR